MTIKMKNIAAPSIPKYFILLDVSDVLVVDDEFEENFALDSPEKKPSEDELVLEFVSPKEKNIAI